MANEVKTTFTGDTSNLTKAFTNVGADSKAMAQTVGRSSSDVKESFDKLEEGAGGTERGLRGLKDGFTGTSDVMTAFKNGDIVGMIAGFTDLAGFVGDFAGPVIGKIVARFGVMTGATAAQTAATGAATTATTGFNLALLANPIGITVAAIIAAVGVLFVLEQKFGLVSAAVRGLGNVFSDIWPGIKAVINAILAGLEFIGNAAIDVVTGPIGLLNKIPGVKSIIPDVPHIHLPRLHSGGTVMSDGLAVLQAGERVIPAGGSSGGPQTIIVRIGDREIGRVVADALRQNNLIGVT